MSEQGTNPRKNTTMAKYRGFIQGNRGPATRLGSANSGLVAEAQSWDGKVQVHLTCVDGKTQYTVSILPHMGRGPKARIVADGTFPDVHRPAVVMAGIRSVRGW